MPPFNEKIPVYNKDTRREWTEKDILKKILFELRKIRQVLEKDMGTVSTPYSPTGCGGDK
jgi:hypothetical protein